MQTNELCAFPDSCHFRRDNTKRLCGLHQGCVHYEELQPLFDVDAFGLAEFWGTGQHVSQLGGVSICPGRRSPVPGSRWGMAGNSTRVNQLSVTISKYLGMLTWEDKRLTLARSSPVHGLSASRFLTTCGRWHILVGVCGPVKSLFANEQKRKWRETTLPF